MKKVTLLAIGDSVDFDSFKKFDKEKRFILSQGMHYASLDYETLFRTKTLDVPGDNILVLTFFPFKYWDKNIECKNYKGLYGNLRFLRKFQKFNQVLVARIKKLLHGRQIIFLNDPRITAGYRDKAVVMRKLSRFGVKVPPRIKARNLEDIRKVLSKGIAIYIKPRCGSMGKGITHLTKDKWQTNFTVQGGKIIQRCSDYGWEFKDVTGNGNFLRRLLRGDFISEEEIPSFMVQNKKVDLRIYGCLGKVLYIYPRKNNSQAVTTNISQGGTGSPALLKRIPPRLISKIEKQVSTTMRVLGLELAGIDVILDKDLRHVYVIDINMFPGFPKRRTHNLARQVIREIKRKVSNGYSGTRG